MILYVLMIFLVNMQNLLQLLIRFKKFLEESGCKPSKKLVSVNHFLNEYNYMKEAVKNSKSINLDDI